MKNAVNPASMPGTREVYEAPVIDTVEVQVEQGFQTSSPAGLDSTDEDYLF